MSASSTSTSLPPPASYGQTFDWHKYGSGYGNENSRQYTESLTGTPSQYQQQKYYDNNRAQSAFYNPKTGFIHVTSDNVAEDHITNDDWNRWAKVANYESYKKLKVMNAAGQKNLDQANFDYIMPEFQDQALRYYQAYKTHGAAVITSSEFPQISVTQVSQALLNRQALVAQKYNLLGFPDKLTVSDSINITYPEYNNTTQSVRVGYKENEAIDTAGFGQFTQTNVTLKKAGAGLAFTEEFYMRQTSVDIQSLLLEKIALDFTAARYNRIVTKLSALTGLATAQTPPSWSLYAAANVQSTNRPYYDLNAARLAVSGSDRLAAVDTIITNERNFMDYYSNTWTTGAFNANVAIAPNIDQIVNNPPNIPWCKQWIINEDIPTGSAYVLDHRYILDIEGPRKTQQINTYNPDQTIFIQKEWFEIINPTTRSTWGRKLTGI